MTKQKMIIELCMGSSCYSRGNGSIVERIEQYVAKHSLQDEVMLKGRLCSGNCSAGPCMTIGDRDYTGITPDELGGILNRHMGIEDYG